jgi:nucleoside-diphosphate-sugar epimerase
MKILITGGAGFIGTHLTKHLSDKGHEAIGVDFQDGDLRVDGVADFLVRYYAPDVVIHLAAQVGIYFNEQDVVHSVNSNTIMTIRVAKAAAKYGARLIHTSTSEVYGKAGEQV